MVILIALGDSGIKEDTSVKLTDIVMPEREIDTFMSEVDKPDKPDEQPEDIAQPELDLQPLTGLDVSQLQNLNQILKQAGHFLEMVNISHYLKLYLFILGELKKEGQWVMR